MHDTSMTASSPRPVPQVLQQMNGLGNLSERVTEAACELERRLSSILRPELDVSPDKNCTDSRDGQVLLAAALIEHNATLHRALGKLESILSRIEV